MVDEYAQLVAADPRRKELDRKGESIFAGGDSDMALCCRRVGLRNGEFFPACALAHLIPKSRLTQSFFLKAAFGGGYSFTLLDYLYGFPSGRGQDGALSRCVMLVRQARRTRLERQMSAEEQKGESRAWELIRKWKHQTR